MKELLLLFFVSAFGFSQTLYKGNVNENGLPIPGVNVCVKNTTRCTQSDFDGNYQILVRIGDELELSYIGMKTQIIKINHLSLDKGYEKVSQIFSDDYAVKLERIDSVEVSESIGVFHSGALKNMQFLSIKKIIKNSNDFYIFKSASDYHKLSVELSHDFIFSTPIRLARYQKKYAQGRSINGQLVYQSPETNEIFNWGPNINSLEYSANPTEFYPQGNIVNQSTGTGNLLELYDSNDFFQNATESKSSLMAQIESPKGNFLKINLAYKKGNISIPTSRNDEITMVAKYFRKVSEYSNIETLLSYNDFENNLSNSNFGINKIVFANAITPIHFDTNIASTLLNGSQRSYSVFENNPYYLIKNNLDKNKSKTISFNFSNKYKKEHFLNIINTSFQSSEINNTNGQNPYFASIVVPDFNKRTEKFLNFSVSDVYKYEFDYNRFLESKIDFRFQERKLERNYFNGFASPSDFPVNSLIQNKLDILQKRVEVFFNLNGSYTFNRIFSYDDQIDLKLNSDLNYSSTAKGNFLSNFIASAEFKKLFDIQLSFKASQSFNQIEPSLQNNNLNFNSLRYEVSEFKQLNNNLELITPKNATPTNEAVTNLGLAYNLNYRWNFNLNYYYKRIENLYTPVFNLNSINWSPDVNYKQNGVEFEIEKLNYYSSRGFAYTFNLNFTYYKNEVTSLNNQTRIPFAGFEDVNKNFIVGQPLGVIVGNGYLRDENQNVIIDDQGFPIEDSQPKILGNPNPDFVVGFFNSFRYKKISLNLSFDWSQGGEIWNGTQQTLNYYGKSKATENQRNIQNYIFNGVTQSGLTNMQSVSFYDINLPVEQNRWARYGVDGVAEDGIEDATYFRLNSINLSYSNEFNYFKDKLNFTVSFYMNNVFIVSKSKFAFSNNSMFNSVETSGLDYFNSPMMRSFGTSLTIKF